ncbi:MAG: hypothetical protein A3G34_06790 [Candidatus Lindowbacteria bacterium RIFCSPLOWO2_12_FULL_62_27]|nr:MAG: hypothetical protein A3G34_06790 [Candidatus Lindowbacteria bacterium RIFCSPLOWO2_12_FULL_62_27]OGH62298.1 MAG: hypothetical protein A3I06_14400 [Candidatus Lindowbacteria bacterium RIFCSPLOWO2_02_FULL_62_12]
MILLTEPMTKTDLCGLARKQFGNMMKAVVDVTQERMAVGGELHADEEALLLERGSLSEDLWGINLYPDRGRADWIEFDAMINIRPSRGNRSRGVEDAALRNKIMDIVNKWIPD